ncbi:MAG: glycosyltransferase family 2 protein [Ruminococcaceae bacterium]|nr:glycosyltransferase family 2 protein [Oscillospiraceae bacterium]
MQKGKVSVIIPTYKGDDNVVRAVDSALNQTYKNIEIIVVDDNGKGTEEQLKTEAVLKKYIDEGKILYLAHEQNINGSAARNTGARNATGEYIALLDDDDEFLPENIENHVNCFKNLSEEYGITHCAIKRFYDYGRQEIVPPMHEGDILFEFMCGKVKMGSSCIMVRKSVFDEVNGFDESFRRHQDWEFAARILSKYKAAIVNEVGLNKYQLLRNSAKNPEQYEKNRLYYLEKMKFIIDTFDKKDRNKIYNAHYQQIAIDYFKAKKFGKCFKWTIKTTNPIKCWATIVRDALRFIKRRYL